MTCCDYNQCTNGPGCPVRQTPVDTISTTGTIAASAPSRCRHRPNCTDDYCPGRAHRPPHTTTLITDNSDGSDAGLPEGPPFIECGAPFTWADELRYWLTVALIIFTCVAIGASIAGYSLHR